MPRFTFVSGAFGSSTMRGSGSSGSPSAGTVAGTASGWGCARAMRAASAMAAAAATYSADGCLISISSGSFARGSMISTVTPMIPGLSFAAAKPRSIQRLRGSPQYLM